ncbi:hypothetical protein JQN72_04830 [Phycicoccus sp. CSK15P-2]|uniref:hypothetical protein n=1 Tax=Phycicoccus sp. CSK15P-2 TaxID=2807627 RepID=UPI00194E3A8F|nr:hypothetical protein [Phycicoccus sp. CSK15P-2]MBM6403568.1 hypothetical protein [Phycicoccus sp. CSK15P-2]
MLTTLRRLLGAVVSAGLAGGSLVVAAAPAAAVEGLTVAARSTYTVDVEDEVVHARVELDLRNVSPDRRADGGVYTYYFSAYTLPVPATATRLRAESGGRDLDTTTSRTDEPGISLAEVSFPNLLYGQERSIVVTFDIEGAAPRSEDPTRVGRGFATFVAYGPGDEGSNTLRVDTPSSMSFASTFDGFEDTEDDGRTVYEASGSSTGGAGLWAAVSVRDPEQVSERVVDVGDLSFVLEAFPGDDQWSEFVAGRVTEGIPALEALVGNTWPGGLERIREDASPSLQGFDGWFDPTGEEIVVGEQLDDDLIFHELSHAWVSGETFDERWVYEGLAQTIAERAVTATGGTPAKRRDVSRGSDLAVALNAWDGSAGSRSAEVDQYAYPASHQVMTSLLEDLDDEAFAAVVGAGIRGERAYDPPGTVTPSAGRTTWSDWLDLVETRGQVADAPKVFTQWVLTAKQKGRLDDRARERTAYAELDEADGAWLPPEGLRDAMSSWDFDRARSVREAVTDLGDDATAVQAAAETAGLEVPEAVRTAYENAALEDDYTALESSLPAAARSVTAVGRARAVADADHDPFTSLGAWMLGVGSRADQAVALLADGDIAGAQEEAETTTTRQGWSLPLGLAVPVLLLVALAGGAWVVLVARRRTGDAPSPAALPTRPGPALVGPPPAERVDARPSAPGPTEP